MQPATRDTLTRLGRAGLERVESEFAGHFIDAMYQAVQPTGLPYTFELSAAPAGPADVQLLVQPIDLSARDPRPPAPARTRPVTTCSLKPTSGGASFGDGVPVTRSADAPPRPPPVVWSSTRRHDPKARFAMKVRLLWIRDRNVTDILDTTLELTDSAWNPYRLAGDAGERVGAAAARYLLAARGPNAPSREPVP